MTTFDERERAFEAKFAHDAEMQFRASAQRTRNLCLWAANRFGMEGEAAVEYAKATLSYWLSQPGFEHVVSRILSDAADRGIPLTERELRSESDRLLAKAKSELLQPEH